MKKLQYQTPEYAFVALNNEDIISTSLAVNASGIGDEMDWSELK